jgi:hypothetical protein
MSDQTEQPVLLFSYGTLQDQAVQLSTFGRELKGRLDNLPGYKQNLVEITDPAVLCASLIAGKGGSNCARENRFASVSLASAG